jgi:hypothetical protein
MHTDIHRDRRSYKRTDIIHPYIDKGIFMVGRTEKESGKEEGQGKTGKEEGRERPERRDDEKTKRGGTEGERVERREQEKKQNTQRFRL